MTVYNDETYNYLLKVKEEIVKKCDHCSGTGYKVDPTSGEDRACKCMVVFKYIKQLVVSRIPREYWNLTLEELRIGDVYKRLINLYIEHFDSAIAKGLGFLFMGPNGSGKTSLMAEIGKESLIRGSSVVYFTAEKYLSITQTQKDSSLLIDQISQSTFLLLDELDKAYFKEGSVYGPKKLEDLFRQSFSSGKVIISATNMDEESLLDLFGDSLLSMFKRHLKITPVSGDDFSKVKQSRWLDDLKEKYNYMEKNILLAAKRRRDYNSEDYL